MAYSWLTFSAARLQLAARLAVTVPPVSYWEDVELGLYIVEALRVWNALTFTWKETFTFSVAAASAPTWLSLGAMADSPRLRTLTNTALFTLMEYHLLEPATGGTWTGTSQFSIADLSLALQRCRDEAIQISNCNQANPAPIQTTPGNRTIPLPDTFLDVPRARWVPKTGAPSTLQRTDDTALNYYQSGYLQEDPATPKQYNINSLPPLQLEVDIPPVSEGAYDLLALMSGPAFNPPNDALLNVPDDNAWILKWGALADVLGRESEATDRLRAAYCQRRYTDGLKLMQATPWAMQCFVNGVPANFVSVQEMDTYRPEWDSIPGSTPIIITVGTDFFTVMPDPDIDISVSIKLLANAPVPEFDDDFIQCSRDVWDTILDYAQFLASFKMGGAEFTAALVLEQGFTNSALATNARLSKLGLFSNVYEAEGSREVRVQERYPVTTED